MANASLWPSAPQSFHPFNWLKGYWNLVLKWHASNHIPLLPLLPHHHLPHITSATFTSVKRNSLLSSFSCILFNVALSEFDSQYYNIMYIHSLLLNSRPWTETIKTSTFNFKHKTEQGQRQASKKHLILSSQYKCDLTLLLSAYHHACACHLPVHHLPNHDNMSILISEMKEENWVWNISIIALVFSIPEHMVWHSELKWLLHKNY